MVSTQNPFAVIFGCSDSRLAAEIIFDLGLGDAFVVRTAGHVLDAAVLGSLEYSVSVLNVPLIVVLGHDNCGAVTATKDAVQTGVMPPALHPRPGRTHHPLNPDLPARGQNRGQRHGH
ncbi:MAG: hypothetical protein NVS2B15_16420 [Pseudarthrobacter sp.]